MNIEEVRAYVLSLYGVTEDQPFGDDNITFRLEGKIFLCLWLGCEWQADAGPRFAIKLTPERNEALREAYAAVTPAWHWNKKHWTDVFYASIDEETVRLWIRESYQLMVSKLPKSLRLRYESGTASTATHFATYE